VNTQRATLSLLIGGLLACGPTRSVPTFVTTNDPYRCLIEFEGPWQTAFTTTSWFFDSRRQCPASINVFGGDTVPFNVTATSLRNDMLVTGNTWQVWDNLGRTRGSGGVQVFKFPTGDQARVEGQYIGGMGQIVSGVGEMPTYRDTGRIRVKFAGQGDVVLRTQTFVQRIPHGQQPTLMGPTTASTGYPSHFYIYTHGTTEPVGLRYTWYVNGQEVVPYSYQHTLNHSFNVDGWHTVQAKVYWADNSEEWMTLNVYSMNCGGPNQCLRAAPEPPPTNLPDARMREASRWTRSINGRQ
jgi:hypothetical protein